MLESFYKIAKGDIVLFESEIESYKVKLYLHKNEYVPSYELILEISKPNSSFDDPIWIDLPNNMWIQIDKDYNVRIVKFLERDEAIQLLKNVEEVPKVIDAKEILRKEKS
ncbi:MAG TPA: hypothetical protein EYH04_02590 [Archaeoglobus profundus]|nr:hypothetical protein [Archaeoglobus profundus]